MMHLFLKYRWVMVLLAAAILVRVFLFLGVMDKTPHMDFFVYREWVKKSYSVGLAHVYSTPSPDNIIGVNQPPGSMYILRFSYDAYLLASRILTYVFHLPVGSTLWINDALFVLFCASHPCLQTLY